MSNIANKQHNKEEKASDISQTSIQTGDILFLSKNTDLLSQAIDLVTQTNNNTHFTHVGIAEVDLSQITVYHAKPKTGVCSENLHQFAQQYAQISVYRLQQEFQAEIPKALRIAKLLIGQPYDETFIHQNPGFYCSNYIQQIFEHKNIFNLEPMTFKDPQTGEFSPIWIQHYYKLNIPIPEGQPGCNPNGLAASLNICPITKIPTANLL